jgi:hypothetical protein
MNDHDCSDKYPEANHNDDYSSYHHTYANNPKYDYPEANDNDDCSNSPAPKPTTTQVLPP